MNLKSYCDGWLQVNDCVSISVRDYGWGSDTYEGMIIKMGKEITVLFTDGDVCSYSLSDNKLSHLNARRSFIVTEKIIEVLERMEKQNTKLEEQKAKINACLGQLLQ